MGNGVGWANILATQNMCATYNGKIVASLSYGPQAPMCIQRTQDQVDEYIAQNTPWETIIEHSAGGPILASMLNEDSTDITEYVVIEDVPSDALSNIVFEPKFYMK